MGWKFRLFATKFFGMMVARDGVEPPTPAFSERNSQVVSTTYKVSGDCLTTCKYVVEDGKRVDETGDRSLFSCGDGLRLPTPRLRGLLHSRCRNSCVVRDEGVRFGDGWSGYRRERALIGYITL